MSFVNGLGEEIVYLDEKGAFVLRDISSRPEDKGQMVWRASHQRLFAGSARGTPSCGWRFIAELADVRFPVVQAEFQTFSVHIRPL